MPVLTQSPGVSKASLWTGHLLSALAILFLIVDGAMKVLNTRVAVQATVELGYPASAVPVIGVILLVCTLLYVFPRTSILGAVLLTGYLGGAVASSMRAGAPLFNQLFPVIFGVVVWGGLYLRDRRLHAIFPGQG